MGFMIDFKMTDYKDILPDPYEYLKNDFIINADEFTKGNIDNCIWKKHRPSLAEVNSKEYRERIATRVLKTGAWVAIKDEIIWLPPNVYFAYEFGSAGSSDFELRLKRIKHAYEKIRAINNPNCIGLLTLKNRGDGQTTFSIHDAFWQCLDGNMEVGQIGIQSINRNLAINPCWNYIQTLWQSLPQWFKSDLCSDFASGNNIAEKMQWQRSADDALGLKARNVLLTYYPSGTPMDSKHDVKWALLDEVCKWNECSFYDVFTNYCKFIMPGFERRGMFDMFSSPADHNCKSNEEVYQLWKDSDTKQMTENGTTKSRIHRIYSNPLEGIHTAYDKWGDADPEKIYKHIMSEREKKPKEKLLGEIRGYPLNESEMFETTDNSSVWDNQKGINARKIYLLGTRFKSEETKEPKVIYGNLEWKDGIRDSQVVFRQSDKSQFDVHDARFCFSYLPPARDSLRTIYKPNHYGEDIIGIDSVDKRYANKGHSNFAMINYRFRDLHESGINNRPTMIYCCRPLPIEISYEDAIKAAVFNQAQVQVESLNTKIVDYFEDRGYIHWMLSKIGMPKNSLVKGDAPSGKSAFMNEIVGLINAHTNVPLTVDDPYLLEGHWFSELLDDLSIFNLADTHKNDLSMSFGQALLGAAKILFKKPKNGNGVSNSVISYLMS